MTANIGCKLSTMIILAHEITWNIVLNLNVQSLSKLLIYLLTINKNYFISKTSLKFDKLQIYIIPQSSLLLFTNYFLFIYTIASGQSIMQKINILFKQK